MPDKYTMPGAYDTQKLPRIKPEAYQTRQQRTQGMILQVCAALEEKGYNPVNQLTGYILSGDPTYITSYKEARKIIGRLERDELLEEVIRFYISELGCL